MPQITRSALVMYSADAMFNLVNDVASYPEFLPNCAGSTILESSDNLMVASVQIAKGGINKSFTTRNSITLNERIDMELVDGPFDLLTGGWQFVPLDENASKVILELDYQFSSKLIEMAFGSVFKEVANNMVAAFTERAKVIYGVPQL